MKLASVLTMEAINTPIAQSTNKLAQVRQQTQAEAHPAPSVHQQQVQRSPGPAMAM